MNFVFKRRRFRIARYFFPACLLIRALIAPLDAPAQEAQPSEYQVKAAFLFNFSKFVEWPTNAFAGGQTNLVIGVFGRDPFQGDLDRLVAGQKIGCHPVVVRQVATVAELQGCQVLFIPASSADRVSDVMNALGRQPALTVGESDGFCDKGGMINFVLVNGRVHFDINNNAARAAGLKISSKLLPLARRLQNDN